MGEPDDAKAKWLQGLGVKNVGGGTATTAAPSPDAADVEYNSPPVMASKSFLDLNSPEMKAVLMKTVEEQAEKDRKEALAAIEKARKALSDAKAFIQGLPDDQLRKMSYATVMAEVRKRFPAAADVSQLVKDVSVRVPDLKGKLPSKKALMDVVETAVKARGMELTWSMSTGKDLQTLATDRLLAAYMSELPSEISVQIVGGVVRLTSVGAALAVKTPAGELDATAGKGGAVVELKSKDYTIQVSNEGWKEFDPKLRAKWQRIADEASEVAKLQEKLTADLTADLEKQEAEFNLRWKKLQAEVTATVQVSEEKISASIAYLKKDKNDKEAVKASADVEADFKAMQGKLKAYFSNPSVKAVLEVSASAEKVSAKLEVTAVKSGVVVTANFEKALDETKAAIEVMLREGKTTIAAELKKKADDLTAKIKIVHETKDLKLAAELEKTLKDVRSTIEVQFTTGKATLKGGVSGSTSGEFGGKAEIDIALDEGRSFPIEGAKLSFTANVRNTGYKFEVAFSMGEPAEASSLQDLFKDADTQIKELYKLAGDKGVRSLKDAEAVNKKLQEVMAPIKASASKVKMLKGKSAIQASFGFSIEGDWPSGGKASAPAAMFGAKLIF